MDLNPLLTRLLEKQNAQLILLTHLIICASENNKVRLNWAKSFQEMASQNDDQLLDSELETLSNWDEQEWEW